MVGKYLFRLSKCANEMQEVVVLAGRQNRTADCFRPGLKERRASFYVFGFDAQSYSEYKN